jgi:excisionase family DNA binding protein
VLQGFSGKLVSPREAAALLGVNRETIYRLCARGEVPHVRVGSVLRVDLAGYLAQRQGLVRGPLLAASASKRPFTFISA